MKTKSVFISKRFIPEWNGNKDLPAHEQMVIVFRAIPSTAQKKDYMSFAFGGGKTEVIYNDALLVTTFVEKIENYEDESVDKITGNTTVKKITTGSELAALNNSTLNDLFTEIRNYLFPEADELDAGESKA